MSALLRRLGIQPRPFRALVRTFVTLDLRGQLYGLSTGAKAGELIPPLFWVYGQMLTVSVLLCACLQGRVDARFFAFANLTVGALLVFSAVVVEFHEAAFDPQDVTVIGHRPVTGRTWSAARFVNLVGYVALVTLAVSIFPSVMGVGLRDTDVGWLIRYPIASVIACGASASLALALYVMGGFGARFDGLRQALAWTQIGGILALFYGGQFMLRNGTGAVSMMSYAPPEWVQNAPTWHLAPFVSDGSWMPGLAGLGVMLLLAAVAVWGLQRAWSGVASVHVRQAATVGRSRLDALLTLGLPRTGQAVARLAAALMGRDRELRSRIAPALGMVVTVPIIGMVAGEYASPASGWDGAAVVPVGSVVVLCGALPSVAHALLHSRDASAAFRLVPFWGPTARRGVHRAIWLRLIAPLLAVHGVAVALYWRAPGVALLFTVASVALVDAVLRVVLRSVLDQPIGSKTWRRGGTAGSISLLIGGVSALASVLAAGFAVAVFSPWALLALAALYGIGSFTVARTDGGGR